MLFNGLGGQYLLQGQCGPTFDELGFFDSLFQDLSIRL